VGRARAAGEFTPDTIIVRVFPDDPRRALDARVDALVTADGATLDYARALPDYRLAALPWHATYVLATPARSGPTQPDARDLEVFARTAVRAPVRGAQLPHWWQGCAPWPAAAGRTASLDVMYVDHDAAARDIAERIVALAWPRDRAPAWVRDALPTYGAPPRARPVSEAVIRSGAAQHALARVLILPRIAVGGCNELPRRLETDATAFAGMITPLVDVRRYLIHRDGIGRVRADASGIIRIGR
jgi:hypothetical protein